ncbi:MAG: molybdopterin biosynthesis protein [Desulfurococcus sp.]|nr:molybdopterin biosynthesis protein [Desulfurococcus sp.]
MSRKIFHELLSIKDAVRLVEEKVKPAPKGVEEIDLLDAAGRILAEDIYAPLDYPPFDRSEVDGYAVRSIDVEWADELSPVVLRVVGFIGVGEEPSVACSQGKAVEIATGAVIPRECDSIVIEEHVERSGESLKVYRSVSPGENISTAGSDISAGDLVLLKGTKLSHEHIAVLSGLGVKKVKVYVKPKAAVYSTGVEITEPGFPLTLGKVYDVNGRLITSYLRELGVDAVFKGLLPDDYSIVREEIEKSINEYDLVLTSGGTSAGLGDLVYRVFEDLGEVLVHGLKTKPGKPTVIALTSNGKLLIGLPGFPLSCYMILRGVVKPIVARMTGVREIEPIADAVLPMRIRKQVGKAWLIPVSLVEGPRGYAAYPVSFSSGSIASLVYSDGYIELPEDLDLVEAGSRVKVYLFKPVEVSSRLNIIGSNDPLLMDILREAGLAYNSRILNVGSLAGWRAVARGEADIAPTHLLDEESMVYNKPFLKRFNLESKAVLIRGFDRLIGLVVAKGNPKRISSIEDLLRSDVRIVNRVKGSGVRVYLDYMLKKLLAEKGVEADPSRVVNGYTYEVKTHTAVALAVKQGRADAGIASGYVAEMFSLDFIPLTWEQYDFLVPKDRLRKTSVEEFIRVLKNTELVERSMRYKGYYRIPADIGEPV